MFGLSPQEAQAIFLGPKRISSALRILQHVAAVDRGGVTCDECEKALDLPHQSVSPRYNELIRSGCLVMTPFKRTTRSGGSAHAYMVAPDANFKKFLGVCQSKAPLKQQPHDEQILRISRRFLAQWKKARTKKGREDASVALINALVALKIP